MAKFFLKSQTNELCVCLFFFSGKKISQVAKFRHKKTVCKIFWLFLVDHFFFFFHFLGNFFSLKQGRNLQQNILIEK